MIFATVGTQLPFNRLIRTLDEWAASNPEVEVFAQTGTTQYVPGSINWQSRMSPKEFELKLKQCSMVVAHAGIGSIISAMELGKPIIVMPRKASLSEHRNDHQLATAEEFRRKQLVQVAFDASSLKEQLDAMDFLATGVSLVPQASPELLGKLRDFIRSEV